MADRALVLGGGGPVGIAWESGLVAGLKEGGIDVARADFIMGTSAGSFVGAQIAGGRDVAELARAQMDRQVPAPRRDGQPTNAPPPDLTPLVTMMTRGKRDDQTPEQYRAEIGAFALSTKTIDEEQFIASFGSIGVGERVWPANFACTAVNAHNGEFKVWRAEDNVPLARAIASSCCVPGIYPPVPINGRVWIDGGMRSSINADVAAGHKRVLIVAVTNPQRAPMLQKALDSERGVIAEKGGVSELIIPDDASVEAFGPNLMDFRRRAGAAEAGLAQGRQEAARLKAFWN